MLQVNRRVNYPMIGKLIGKAAYEKLINSMGGVKVEGVFEKSFYISLGNDELIRVIKDDEFISASSIVVDMPVGICGFNSAGIEKGMEIEFKGDDLLIGDESVISGFNKIRHWESPPVPRGEEVLDLKLVSLNLRVLRDLIYTVPSREGLVPVLEKVEMLGPVELFLKPQEESFAEKARAGIERTMWGLYYQDIDSFVKSAERLIGLGPGLTPSCDDFLAGLILSLKIGEVILNENGDEERRFYNETGKKISVMAVGRTTPFSLSMLKEASECVCPLVVTELIYSLLTRDTGHVAENSKRLFKMGETSGADIAIGVFYGIRFLVSKFENLEVLDGAS